jgi:hypothetical protein
MFVQLAPMLTDEFRRARFASHPIEINQQWVQIVSLARTTNTLLVDLERERGQRRSADENVITMVFAAVESDQRCPRRRWTGFEQDECGVEFAFGSVELRRICESRRRATNVLGIEPARELEQRLADLAALATAAELSGLFRDDIVDRSPSERALRLDAGYNLVFCAGHVDVPVLKDGSTDWTRVSRIRIIALEARHA